MRSASRFGRVAAPVFGNPSLPSASCSAWRAHH